MHHRQRYLILVAAVLMQTGLGATYSWSIFADALSRQLTLNKATAQLPFTAFYIALPATMIFSGILLRRLGIRGCAILGGLIFGGGWMFASLGGRHFAYTILGVGLLGGIGVGLAYVVPISVGMQWFPRHKGLVTGLIVAGFGAGAAVVSKVAESLMRSGETTALDVLLMLGAVFATVIALTGSLMRLPQTPPVQAGISLEPEEEPRWRYIVFGGSFRLLYLAMFTGLAAGFTIIANLKQLCPNIDMAAGAVAVGVLAIANAAGRVSWGFAFDRLFSTAAIRYNLLAQAAVLLAAPLLSRTPTGLYVLAALAGFNYGGVLVLYASATAQNWGARRVGRIYGWLFSANIPASLAPVAAAAVYDRANTFTPALLTLAALLLVAGLMSRLIQIR